MFTHRDFRRTFLADVLAGTDLPNLCPGRTAIIPDVIGLPSVPRAAVLLRSFRACIGGPWRPVMRAARPRVCRFHRESVHGHPDVDAETLSRVRRV